jgi:hypothetical protein
MKKYSIVRVGHEYIVRADEENILKVASRRRAARLVTDAAELLEMQSERSQSEASLQADNESSSDQDPSGS